jgi:hypothetical protein
MTENEKKKTEKDMLEKVSSLNQQLHDVEKMREKSDAVINKTYQEKNEKLQAEKLRLEQLKKLHTTIGSETVNAADAKFTF